MPSFARSPKIYSSLKLTDAVQKLKTEAAVLVAV